MAPKKSTPKKASTKKTTVSPAPAPSPAPKVAAPVAALSPLQQKALELQQQPKPVVRRDGYGRPAAPTPVAQAPKSVARYIVEFDDGSALVAEGEIATVIFKFVERCEEICTTQALAYYEGPGMKKLTPEEYLAYCSQ